MNVQSLFIIFSHVVTLLQIMKVFNWSG